MHSLDLLIQQIKPKSPSWPRYGSFGVLFRQSSAFGELLRCDSVLAALRASCFAGQSKSCGPLSLERGAHDGSQALRKRLFWLPSQGHRRQTTRIESSAGVCDTRWYAFKRFAEAQNRVHTRLNISFRYRIPVDFVEKYLHCL